MGAYNHVVHEARGNKQGRADRQRLGSMIDRLGSVIDIIACSDDNAHDGLTRTSECFVSR